MNSHADYVLHLADNALILGQRLSEWCGHAPVLEEDLALANMALDLLGQARALLTHAGALDGSGRDEDALAFLRDAHDYRNVTLVELPNGDFAVTVIRNLLMSAFNLNVYQALAGSRDTVLAQIANKSIGEVRYHLRHACDWTVRLGDGTAQSHRRAQDALNLLWPYTGELFDTDESERAAQASGMGVAPDTLHTQWLAVVEPVLRAATLATPRTVAPGDAPIATALATTDGATANAGAPHADRVRMPPAGKRGFHSAAFIDLLGDMQRLQRQHPGARW